jgi:hypothetical protein
VSAEVVATATTSLPNLLLRAGGVADDLVDDLGAARTRQVVGHVGEHHQA